MEEIDRRKVILLFIFCSLLHFPQAEIQVKENDEVELSKKNIFSFTCLEKFYLNSVWR